MIHDVAMYVCAHVYTAGPKPDTQIHVRTHMHILIFMKYIMVEYTDTTDINQIFN